MKPLTNVFCCLSVAVLCGCGIVRNIAAVSNVAPSIKFRTLVGSNSDEHFYNVAAQSAAIHSQVELDAFLSDLKMDYGRPASGSLPPIDFTSEIGVLVFFGGQACTAYSGSIESIEERTDRLVVHPVRWVPPSGTICGQMVVYPFHYVSVPKTSKPIEFAPTVSKETPGTWWSIF